MWIDVRALVFWRVELSGLWKAFVFLFCLVLLLMDLEP